MLAAPSLAVLAAGMFTLKRRWETRRYIELRFDMSVRGPSHRELESQVAANTAPTGLRPSDRTVRRPHPEERAAAPAGSCSECETVARTNAQMSSPPVQERIDDSGFVCRTHHPGAKCVLRPARRSRPLTPHLMVPHKAMPSSTRSGVVWSGTYNPPSTNQTTVSQLFTLLSRRQPLPIPRRHAWRTITRRTPRPTALMAAHPLRDDEPCPYLARRRQSTSQDAAPPRIRVRDDHSTATAPRERPANRGSSSEYPGGTQFGLFLAATALAAAQRPLIASATFLRTPLCRSSDRDHRPNAPVRETSTCVGNS